MSLDHYVASKDELLDAMIDKIYEEIELPPEETDGQSAMRRRAVFTCLRKAGFSTLMATHANWLLDSYVYGFALEEASLPFDTADALSGMTTDVYLPQLLPEQFPYLNESAAALVAAGYDAAEEFVFGLELALAALEPLRASA